MWKAAGPPDSCLTHKDAMMYLRYSLLAPLSLGMVLVSYIVSPFLAALSVIMGRDTLPGILQWFYTHDDTLDGGQHQLGWPSASGIKLIWQRMLWIMRNPAYGFNAKVLGFPDKGAKKISQKEKYGGDKWDQKNNSTLSALMEYDGKRYFSYRIIRPYGPFAFNLWIGWNYVAYGGWHQLKFSVNPFRMKR